ncbi:MAG: hypothetical protein AB7L84_05625 [Acidimicrobiia bacterium]
MPDRTEVALGAVIRCLRDMVLPAVADRAEVAEQLRFSVDQLDLLARRLPHLAERASFELEHHLRTAEAVLDLARACDVEVACHLGDEITSAREHAGENGLASSQDASARLAHALRQLVRRIARDDVDGELRAAIERRIVADATERVAFEQDWYSGRARSPRRVATGGRPAPPT